MNNTTSEVRPSETRRWVLFSGYGLRPFFLFAALYAIVSLGAWIHLLAGSSFAAAPVWLPGAVWHGHEMLFGYAGAVIAGFMLTAVPTWTNSPILNPLKLLILFAVWLAGRVAMWGVDAFPPSIVALLDIAFLPTLAVLAGAPVIMRRMYRNLVFVAVLLFLAGANTLIHMEAVSPEWETAQLGLRLSLDGVVLLLVIVGGRIVPAFTTNFLRKKAGAPQLYNSASLTKATILTTVAMIVADAAVAGTPVSGALSLAAGVLVLIRLIGWRGYRCLGEALVWVLHLGYLWLGFGLVLKGVAGFTDAVPETAGIHALSAGAIGTMTMGVMARASLGHTGRVLTASRWLTLAFWLLSLGAVLRLAAVWQSEMLGFGAINVAAAVWSAAFVLFLILFAPILVRRRIDGRPG